MRALEGISALTQPQARVPQRAPVRSMGAPLATPLRRCPQPAMNPLGRPVIRAPRARQLHATAAAAAHAANGAAAAASQAAAGTTAGVTPSKAVPLLDSLMGLPLPVAAARCAALLACCAAGVALGRWVLAWVDKRLCAIMDHNKHASGLSLAAGTALVAMHRPASALLPLYGLSYSLTVLAALTEVAVACSGLGCYPKLHLCGRQLVRFLKWAVQGLQGASQLVLISAATWFLLDWKDRLVARTVDRWQGEAGSEGDGRERLLLPLSHLLTWVLVGGASVAALGALNIDVRPVLALGSVGSLVVGLAAQATLANVVSALSLFTNRPFIVGDRVQLKSLGGSTIVEGVVEEIQPMRTVIRTDTKMPCYVNNKDVAGMMILNESQLCRGSVTPSLASFSSCFTVRYQDVKRVPQLEAAVTEYLAAHPDIDHTLGFGCHMDKFSDNGITLEVKAHLTRAASNRAGAVRSTVLLGVDKVVRDQGAQLAIAGADSLDGAAAGGEAAPVDSKA